ncbi:MAG: DUF1800 family protein, partial [Saprospiraceae bacterium]
MTTLVNCPTGTLDPYVPSDSTPWNRQRVLHLYRRIGFGANPEMVAAALERDPADLIDELLDAAINLPASPAPEWANMLQEDYEDFDDEAAEQYFERILTWVEAMTENGVRERIAFFWSGHFVTLFESYLCGSYLYRYHKLLQENALGNFKNFVHAVGQTPAMLVFLNGVQNTKANPNENYARELYELFTLGRDNGYTQQDIEETARALTGFQRLPDGYCGEIGFLPFTHDDDEKTIFGRTGNWNYDDIHNILFAEHGDRIARYICEKIYTYFISTKIDEVIVMEMAMTFQENDFEIATVLRQLFKSEHFFADAIIGAKIKSPLDIFINFMVETNTPVNDETKEGAAYLAYLLGQQVFNPPDVSGWKGDKSWINSSRLTGRWQGIDFLLFYQYEQFPATLTNFARELTNNSNDPAFITQRITDHFLPNGLQTTAEYVRATEV